MFQVLNFHTKCLLDNYSDISMTLFDIFFMFFCVWRLSTFVWIVEYKWYYNYSKNYEKTKNLLKQPFLCLNNLKPVQIYNEKSSFACWGRILRQIGHLWKTIKLLHTQSNECSKYFEKKYPLASRILFPAQNYKFQAIADIPKSAITVLNV